jgi:hypothetical protein
MRQDRMLQRARDLKAAREEERQKFVDSQIEAKWRYYLLSKSKDKLKLNLELMPKNSEVMILKR